MEEEKKYNEILSKLERYCKYQERCKSDVENKLNKLEVKLEGQKIKRKLLKPLV